MPQARRASTLLMVMGALFLCASALARAEPAPRTLLMLGDSLSANYGIDVAEGWVTLLQQRLAATHPDWRVVNASISGETTAGGAARIADELARHTPALVAIELGANDGLRGLPVEAARANLATMIEAAQRAGARVLLIGMRMPPNYGPEYTQAFAAMYAELARTYRVALLPLLIEPIARDRAAFQDDNLHPTAAAQPKLLDHVWPALAPLLSSD